MTKHKFGNLLLLCAMSTLSSASVKDELNSLSNASAMTSSSDFKDIVDRFENTPDSCNNALSAVCNSSELTYNSFEYVYETSRFSIIKQRIMKTLTSESNKDDLAPLKTERKLFYNCMKLGEEDYNTKQQTLADFEYFMHRIYDHVSTSSSWQSLENLLNRLGFDHTFYEIKVERDPENFVNNIITLQPPSYVDTKRTSEIVKRILDSSNDDLTNDEGWNVWKFFETMKSNKREIELFFDSLLEIISPSFEDKRVPHNQIKTRLHSWLQNDDSHSSDVVKIDWANVIIKEFEKVNIEVYNDEPILIKNKQYFLNLYNLLNSTSNNIISSYILTKMLTEQLPYIDWENYQTFKRLQKQEFCFGETKLYGASFKVFHDIKEEYTNHISFKLNHEILNNIVIVMNTDISFSRILSESRRKFLRSQLKSITVDILQQADRKTVSDYYGDYQASHIYFTDILNYRKMIKNNELSTLRSVLRSPRDEIELYSFVDLVKPRNRLLTKLLTLNMIYELTPNREIVYSSFGVDLAQFLYSLLNENKFADYEYNFKVDQLLLPVYQIYSEPAIKCYKPIQNQNRYTPFINQMLTTMFGIHIAYEAMLQDYQMSGSYPESVKISDLKSISSDKFFFISYMKNHCFLGSNLLLETFLVSDVYFNTFDCFDSADEDVGQSIACRQHPFEMQNSNIFLV